MYFVHNMYLLKENVIFTVTCTLYKKMYLVQCTKICTLQNNLFLVNSILEKLVFLLSFSSFRSDIFHFFSFTNFFLSNKVKKIYYIQQLYCLKKLWFFREITSPVGSEYFSVVGLDRHLRVYKIKGK